MGYAIQQRIGIAGLGLGLLMCALGTLSPYWESTSVNIYGGALTGGVGLWYTCASSYYGSSCNYIEAESGNTAGAKLWVCRVFSLFTLILAMAAFCGGLCGCRNVSGGRTTGQGISALASGGAGIITLAVFGSIFVQDSYGWSFIVFIIGTILIIIAGLLLVTARQTNTANNQGMVLTSGSAPTVVVNSNTSSQQGYMGQGYPMVQQQPYPGQAYPGQTYPGQAYPGQAYQYPPPGVHQSTESSQNSEQKAMVYYNS